MNSIDELVRSGLTVPEDDALELEALAGARQSLGVAMSAADARAVPRPRRWRPRGLSFVPAFAAGVVALVIGVGAVVLIHSQPGSPAVTAAAGGPGASGLIAQLAVLRRPQTAADRLPARAIRLWHVADNPNERVRLLPGFSRLIATIDGRRLYLVVTSPASYLWPPGAGDDVTLLETGPRADSIAARPIPASAFDDSDIVQFVGQPGGSQAQMDAHGLWMSIVPDTVARVRWTVVGTNGRTREMTVPVHANVARIAAAGVRSVTHADWYAANGRRIDTTNALALAEDQQLQQRYLTELSAAETSHVTASAAILNAFSVFSFDSRTGTRLSDGDVISHPSLTELPSGVLGVAENTARLTHMRLDLRQARRLSTPSGETLYVVPGPSTICIVSLGRSELKESPAMAVGAAGSCGMSRASTLSEGESGYTVAHGTQTSYGVVPRAHPRTTISVWGRRKRTITPEDGVYIVTT